MGTGSSSRCKSIFMAFVCICLLLCLSACAKSVAQPVKQTSIPTTAQQHGEASMPGLELPGQQANPTPHASATATATAGKVGGFRGIYVFSSGNASTLATNPNIQGSYLGYPWSLLEPAPGQFAWNIIDNDMKPWVNNGKNVIIRVSASGWATWGPPTSKSWTPPWVYNLGVKSVTEADGAIKPQYWNPAFLQALTDFVNAFAAHYDGNAHITAIEIGVGDGGETKPDTRDTPQRLALWQAIGYTDQIWWDSMQKIMGIYKAAFQHTPLTLMPDTSFIGGTSGFNEHLVVNYAVAHGLWLQNNGVIAGQKPDPTWLKTTIIAEQRLQTVQSGDTLQMDIQLSLDYGASYVLCFESDLTNTANQAVLQKYTAMVQH